MKVNSLCGNALLEVIFNLQPILVASILLSFLNRLIQLAVMSLRSHGSAVLSTQAEPID